MHHDFNFADVGSLAQKGEPLARGPTARRWHTHLLSVSRVHELSISGKAYSTIKAHWLPLTPPLQLPHHLSGVPMDILFSLLL